mgnify:CR=1 FL=1
MSKRVNHSSIGSKIKYILHFFKNPRGSLPWDIHKFVSDSPHRLNIFFCAKLLQLLAYIHNDAEYRALYIYRFLPDCLINLLLTRPELSVVRSTSSIIPVSYLLPRRLKYYRYQLLFPTSGNLHVISDGIQISHRQFPAL